MVACRSAAAATMAMATIVNTAREQMGGIERQGLVCWCVRRGLFCLLTTRRRWASWNVSYWTKGTCCSGMATRTAPAVSLKIVALCLFLGLTLHCFVVPNVPARGGCAPAAGCSCCLVVADGWHGVEKGGTEVCPQEAARDDGARRVGWVAPPYKWIG
eukprot:COSAG02_NODE_22656_length_745_cov_0.681115_2_plen_158_part_00